MPNCTPVAPVPDLRERMIARDATIRELSKFSGVSFSYVSQARRGRPVSTFIAECLLTALNTRSFARLKRGKNRKKVL